MKILLNSYLHSAQTKPKQLNFKHNIGNDKGLKAMPPLTLKEDTFEKPDIDYEIGSNIVKAMLESCLHADEHGNFKLSPLFTQNEDTRAFEQEFNRYMKERPAFKRKEKIALNSMLKAILNAKNELCSTKGVITPKECELKFDKL